MDLPGELFERDDEALWCEMVRARVGDAEVVSSSVKPPVVPMVDDFDLRPLPEADELELDEVDPLLPPAMSDDVVLILRFDAILRSPGAIGLAGEGGRPAPMPPSGLRRWGVDFIFAGERGGLNGADSVLGTLRVVTCPETPACLAAVS